MAYEGGVDITKNNFDKIAQKIITQAAETVVNSANAIEGEIRARRWSSKIPVKTRLTNKFQAEVVVGSRRRFFAGFNEYGTIHQPPKPVVRPAAERESRRFVAEAKSVLKALEDIGS